MPVLSSCTPTRAGRLEVEAQTREGMETGVGPGDWGLGLGIRRRVLCRRSLHTSLRVPGKFSVFRD